MTALARGLQVLACFRSGDAQLGNQELAERCKLPKSTVSRLTMTLTRLGYLIQVPDTGRYRLGMATLSLGAAMLSRLDVGARIPLATSAIGRAYLAAIDERERRDILAQVQQHDEAAWPRVRAGIERALKDHAKLGVTCSFGAGRRK